VRFHGGSRGRGDPLRPRDRSHPPRPGRRRRLSVDIGRYVVLPCPQLPRPW